MSQADEMTANEVWSLAPSFPKSLCEAQAWPSGLGGGGQEEDAPQPPEAVAWDGWDTQCPGGEHLPWPHPLFCRVSPPPSFPPGTETRQPGALQL